MSEAFASLVGRRQSGSAFFVDGVRLRRGWHDSNRQRALVSQSLSLHLVGVLLAEASEVDLDIGVQYGIAPDVPSFLPAAALVRASDAYTVIPSLLAATIVDAFGLCRLSVTGPATRVAIVLDDRCDGP